MTPAQLETLIRNQFNALNDTFFSSDEIHSYISKYAKQVSFEIPCIEDVDTSQVTVASQRNYNLPTGAFAIKTLLVDDKAIPEITLKDGEDREIWDDATDGDAEEFYIHNDIIYLNPPPSTAGLTITIYYYEYHPDIVIGGSLVIPVPFHERLANGVLADMYAKDQNFNSSNWYMTQWLKTDLPSMREFMEKKKRGNKFRTVRIVE
jgi:hypothetical protein